MHADCSFLLSLLLSPLALPLSSPDTCNDFPACALSYTQLNITKEDFLEEMNKTEALDPVRGERVWSAFQSQLESGSVIFLSNGTMQFSMPPTHWLATFLPAPLCDAIEAAYAAARRCYLQLPLKYRRRLEARLDSFVSSGALHGLLILLILIIVGDMIIDLMKDSGKAAETEPAAADTTSRGRTSGANKKKD